MKYSWIRLDSTLAIHDKQLQIHGGASGVRDLGLIESALARPKNRHYYESSTSVVELAAEYGFGLTKNHGFVDGNKRTAYVVTRLFLKIHGFDFLCEPHHRVSIFEALGAGQVTKDQFFSWMIDNTSEIDETASPKKSFFGPR